MSGLIQLGETDAVACVGDSCALPSQRNTPDNPETSTPSEAAAETAH